MGGRKLFLRDPRAAGLRRPLRAGRGLARSPTRSNTRRETSQTCARSSAICCCRWYFHARMAEEQGRFDFGDVVDAITRKLIRRHPHVFGDARDLSSDEVKALWGRIKAEEKRERGEERRAAGMPAEEATGALAGVPLALPALDSRAQAAGEGGQGRVRLERSRAPYSPSCAKRSTKSRPNSTPMTSSASPAKSAICCSRSPISLATSRVDPETALRGANAKFERRWLSMRSEARRGRAGRRPTATLDEMEALWGRGQAAREARL